MKARYGLDLFYHKRKTFVIKFIIASFAIVFVTLFSFIFIKFIGNKLLKRFGISEENHFEQAVSN